MASLAENSFNATAYSWRRWLPPRLAIVSPLFKGGGGQAGGPGLDPSDALDHGAHVGHELVRGRPSLVVHAQFHGDDGRLPRRDVVVKAGGRGGGRVGGGARVSGRG